MADEDEWKKLPTDQKVHHKAWKARAEGYKECIKKFAIWDESSSEFNKYLGLVKKFVTDPNELVRIQGVEATLLFVQNANVAKKTCGEVVSGVILKCFNTKPRIKEAAIDVCLMYIEIEKQESTMEELIKGFSNKQPKVATACLETVIKALSLFGSKVIHVKPLLKEIPTLADHRDKQVRESAKALAVEIYRWVGQAIKSPLQNVNAVILKELEEEWSKTNASGKPTQTRFLRSQQDLKEKLEAKEAAGESCVEDSGDVQEKPEVDAFDLLDPVEILSKLPKNFYEKIEAKKWQERKEVLEICQKLCENLKIEPGDFADLVKALKKVVAKDVNVMLVPIAAKCLAGLAKGIRKKFQPYAIACIDVLLEKFKEKKPMVVVALQEAVDAIYPTTTLQALSETCLEYLENKNPSIREQTGLFLARGVSKPKSSALTKSIITPIVKSLMKNIDHSAPSVRESAYKALGTFLKRCGEKIVMPFFLDLDNIKLEKIKENSEKADVGKGSAVNPAEPAKNASAPPSSKSAAAKSSDSKKKVCKGGKKPPTQKKEATKSSEDANSQEPVLCDIAVQEQVAEFLPAEVITQLGNTNWKERLEGLQSLSQKAKFAGIKSIPCQALVKTLGSGKQGLKDTNFNCLNEKFAIVKYLAENASFSKASAEICIPGLIEKIGDIKCGKYAKEAMTAVAEATSFPWVSEMMLGMSLTYKNPKIHAESLIWLSDTIKEFGLAGSNIKLFIAKIKIGFAATNPTVRAAAFSVMSTMTLYIGVKIQMFFESEKPAILQQIDAEIEKCKGKSPPVPIRGVKSSNTDGGASSGGEDEVEEPADVKVEDLVPRSTIAEIITGGLISKLSDKNWKLRREALEEVTAVLKKANFIEPNIGELATAMKQRLCDSNKILVTTTLGILLKLSVALGPHCKIHVKTLAPGLIGALADTKPNVRQCALNAMNQWLENTNLSLWFEDDMMSSALSVQKHTFLRIELLNWLAEKLLATPKLASSAKEGLEACVKHLYSCCEDRTGDVRAKAQAALPAFIYHLGMDKMVRLSGKLSPTSTNVIQGLLEKAKELVPVRKSKERPTTAQVEIDVYVMSVESQEEEEAKPPSPAVKSKTSAKQPKAAKRLSSKKQTEEPDTGPALIKITNGKEQRMKEEQRLKTLKWVFDAPRDELVFQLKTQMSNCVGNALFTELFHADFQHHIKAIAVFAQALSQQWEDTVGNMDLILRWTTLRFYEKNTTVHMKCLEYLKSLFEKCIDVDYRLSDYEAGAFIPHLITKIGEPKENIRKDVHAIMYQITKVHPAGKIFTHLMHGLLTKNSRQKTECLDELGLLITSHGIEVCQPTPPKALREVATHIGDRDNSVRSAALNVVVCAYNTCGDVVYKFVGKLNEKNMSMLEERIKRSGKFNTETAAPAFAKTEQRGLKQPSKPSFSEKVKISTSGLHSLGAMQGPKPSALVDIYESEYQMPDLLPTDMTDDILNEPDIEIPPRFVSKLAEFTRRNSSETVDNTLNSTISSLASSEIDECLKSRHRLDEIIKHKDKRELLKPRIDQILTSSCIQMRMAMNRYLVNLSPNHRDNDGGDADHRILKTVALCRSLIAIDLAIVKEADLALCASQNVLQDYIQAVTVFMLDNRVKCLPNSGRLISALNALVIELFEKANSTYIMCAVVRLLHFSFEETPDNQIDLFVRCIWRIIPLIKDYVSPPEGSSRPPLQLAPVLNEIHKLLSSRPRDRTQQNDLVVRGMKSVVLTFCQILGIRILDELQDIVGIESSYLLILITKGLKSKYSIFEIEAHPVKQKLAKSVAEKKENIGLENGEISPERKLALIMTKVGNYENTKQGLHELYDFKQRYPDYDVESGYRNLTPLFLNYIRRSLHNIGQEHKNGVMSSSNILKSTNTNQRLTAKEHLEHIKMLRIRCGLPADCTIDRSNKSENKVLTNNTSTLNSTGGSGTLDSERDKDLLAPVTKSIDLESQSDTAEYPSSGMLPPRPATTSNVENLKRRLDKMKKESRKRN